MKSFKDYVKYRNKFNIYEMAAPPVRYTNTAGETETIEEVRKAPIFLDQDDIDYLNQFPPRFWKPALLIRYGKLLYATHEAKINNRSINDKQNIQVGKNATFSVDTGTNKLYDKLTHDVDDSEYSRLRNNDQDRQRYIDHVEKQKLAGTNLGSYGFVLTGYKRDKIKGKEVGVAVGYMEPDASTIDKRLRSWYKGLKDGWYEKEMPEDYKISRVDFSGHKGGRKARGQKEVGMNLPVYPEEKSWTSMEGRVFTSYLPILRPAVMIHSEVFRKHNRYLDAAKQVLSDIHENNLDDYMNLIDVNSPDLLNKTEVEKVANKLKEIKDWLSNFKGKGHTSEMDAKHQEKIRLEKLMKAIEFISRPKNSKILRDKFRVAKSKQEKEEIIKGFLERLYQYFNNVAASIRKEARRFDIHNWNISHFSPSEENPHTNWTGLGTINANWQQPEQVHTALQRILGDGQEGQTDRLISEFWNHLFDREKLTNYIFVGVQSRIEKIKPKDVIQQAIKDALIENKSDIVRNACVYFRNKGAADALIPYATFYKKKFINKEELTKVQQKTMDGWFKRVGRNAQKQGDNYCKIIVQLHERLKHPERWNRLIRIANPGATATPAVTLEEIFRSFYEIHTGAWSATSHRISAVGGLVSKPEDAMRDIVDKTKERIAPSTISPQAEKTPTQEIPPEFASPESLGRAIAQDSVSGTDSPAARSEEALLTKICISVGKKLMGAFKKATSGLLGRWRKK